MILLRCTVLAPVLTRPVKNITEDEAEAFCPTYYGTTLDDCCDLDQQQDPLTVDDTPLD
ncbi:hypothetical protein M6B38_102760 [Iris pallida]|uniref:Uncharacterized protein n=1 Tax=Iris pallida TaxID=29817 RepID=A0AAX6G7G7_IRIPA|nr:hypothetical protein M6B38_102760 [Iris pallida]